MKEFKTTKGRFVVLEGKSGDMLNIREKQYPDAKLIGLARLLDEEQWAEIVEKNGYGHGGWRTYGENMMYWQKSATESGQSLMQSIGCPIVNPLGKDPLHQEYYEFTFEQWQAAEKEIKNYLILKIKE